jgi:hypothetical protein
MSRIGVPFSTEQKSFIWQRPESSSLFLTYWMIIVIS